MEQAMQRTVQIQAGQTPDLGGMERKRVEAVMETLSRLQGRGESLAEVAHDVRNMVTALTLYCDLLEEPGVLAPPYVHYGHELRLLAGASRRLVEKLVALDAQAAQGGGTLPLRAGPRVVPLHSTEVASAGPVENLAADLLALRNLLAAIAGPRIALTMDVLSGSLPVRMSCEDLTRLMVNLVKNSVEAMFAGGRIQIELREKGTMPNATRMLLLTLEDNGPGISESVMAKIFEAGFSTHTEGHSQVDGLAVAHRGLGLSIVRSLVESAGGRIEVGNRLSGGARFAIELPAACR